MHETACMGAADPHLSGDCRAALIDGFREARHGCHVSGGHPQPRAPCTCTVSVQHISAYDALRIFKRAGLEAGVACLCVPGLPPARASFLEP